MRRFLKSFELYNIIYNIILQKKIEEYSVRRNRRVFWKIEEYSEIIEEYFILYCFVFS